jgi:pilus assembly protein Flp/PilA
MSKIFATIRLLAATIMTGLTERVDIKSQKGVTIIEYALLAALIAIALVLSLQALATNIGSLFESNIATSL